MTINAQLHVFSCRGFWYENVYQRGVQFFKPINSLF